MPSTWERTCAPGEEKSDPTPRQKISLKSDALRKEKAFLKTPFFLVLSKQDGASLGERRKSVDGARKVWARGGRSGHQPPRFRHLRRTGRRWSPGAVVSNICSSVEILGRSDSLVFFFGERTVFWSRRVCGAVRSRRAEWCASSSTAPDLELRWFLRVCRGKPRDLLRARLNSRSLPNLSGNETELRGENETQIAPVVGRRSLTRWATVRVAAPLRGERACSRLENELMARRVSRAWMERSFQTGEAARASRRALKVGDAVACDVDDECRATLADEDGSGRRARVTHVRVTHARAWSGPQVRKKQPSLVYLSRREARVGRG